MLCSHFTLKIVRTNLTTQRLWFLGLYQLADRGQCKTLLPDEAVLLTEGALTKSTVESSRIEYYRLSGIPSSRADDSRIFVSLSICSAPENGLQEGPELFYHLGSVPDPDLQTGGWNESNIKSTFETIAHSFVGMVSDHSLEDYYFGYRIAVINLASLAEQDDVYLAVNIRNSQEKVVYQIGYSSVDFPDRQNFSFTNQLLDTSDRAASILVNNQSIADFDSAALYYVKFYPGRRFNSLCAIQASATAKRIPANSENFKPSIKYQLPSVVQDNKKTFYEAYLDSLDADTAYIAWLTIPASPEASSGVTFPPVYFRTKKANPKCFLARDFGTCENVYHSVNIPDHNPRQSIVPTSEIGYRNWTMNHINQRSRFVQRHYRAFDQALKQYDCTAHPYSPVRNCDDCRVSYKNWLCAIAFPKCGEQSDTFPLYPKESPLVVTLDDDFPTVKPCDFLCHFVIQDCPSMLKFRCPGEERTSGKYFPTDGISSWAKHEVQFRKYPFSTNTTPPILPTPFCNAMLTPLRFATPEAVFESSQLPLWPALSFSLLLALISAVGLK